MSGLMCCFWWFVAGVLVGWLLSWLFDKWFGKRQVVAESSARAHVTSTFTPNANHAAGSVSAAVNTATAPVVKVFNAAAASAAGITVKGLDDLEIVEGIGPKIAELLKANGVHTFKELSVLSIPAISAILEKGGARFKLANPETWAEQARLANEGQWQELKTWQDKLYAGTTIKPDNNV